MLFRLVQAEALGFSFTLLLPNFLILCFVVVLLICFIASLWLFPDSFVLSVIICVCVTDSLQSYRRKTDSFILCNNNSEYKFPECTSTPTPRWVTGCPTMAPPPSTTALRLSADRPPTDLIQVTRTSSGVSRDGYRNPVCNRSRG